MGGAGKMIRISHIDHIVMTVSSIDAACDYYMRVLGMGVETFGEGRTALKFGDQKINLHERGHEFKPNAANANTGTQDICLITTTPMDEVLEHLEACGVKTETGIVKRTGAVGQINSVYFRDADGNLIEVASY